MTTLGLIHGGFHTAAASAFGSAPEPIVVIGHSIAGWTAMRLSHVIPVSRPTQLADLLEQIVTEF